MGRHSKLTVGGADSRDRLLHEKGGIRKKWKNRTPIALIYPNSYEIGMSNLGFQLVYQLLNQNDSIVAERIFLPEPGARPLSLESGRPVADFPLLFFSVSFEQDYQNLVGLLEISGIASLSAARTEKSRRIRAQAESGQPLVVAGGVATFMNPEPLSPFVDLFVVGEAEPLLEEVAARLLPGIGCRDREELLAEISADLPGCYAPALYDVAYDPAGNYLATTPKKEFPGLPARVKKVLMDSPG